MSITFKDVDFSYMIKKRKLPVLEKASFSLEGKENIAIVGKSGSGKSTILDLISGVLAAQSGEILVNSQKLSDMSESERAYMRLVTMGYVFQDFKLFDHLSALENLTTVALLAGKTRIEAVERAQELLSLVSLDRRKDHLPTELSGGERQRVAIARALMNEPSIILADEPTGALDAEIRDEVLEVLLATSFDASLIVVTHDPEVAQKVSDKTLVCSEGKLLSKDLQVDNF